MFAVIQTGGKQYRVQAGDLLVVEKLDGNPGDELRFDSVLMVGDGDQITVGAPTVANALVKAVLVETRKGEKVKIFKKIRRQGYRRTRGHRQPESVLRVIGLEGAGKSANWDGKVDLTPRSELVLRARGLASPVAGSAAASSAAAVTPAAVHADTVVTDASPSPVHQAVVVEHADAVNTDAPKKRAAKKTAEAAPADASDASEAAPKKRAAKKTADAGETEAKPAAKKTAAKKTAPKGE
jgi:large subunit ribosomal protein L21